MIEFDVETTGLQPHSGRHYAFSFQFYDGEVAVAYRYGPDNREHHDEIQAWFDRAQEEGIRAWNSKFDWAFAEQGGFRVPTDDRWHDGMLVAFAVDERRSVALKAVAVQLFGEGSDDLQREVKAWLARERRRRAREIKDIEKRIARGEDLPDPGELVEPHYGDVPWSLMEPYGLEDVVLTRRIMDTYEVLLANQPDLVRPVEFERETMASLYNIEKRGLPARIEEYRKLEQEVIENLELLEERVTELAREGDPVVFAKELGRGADIEVSEDGRIISYPAGVGSLLEFNPRSTPQILAALKARGADMSYMSERNGRLGADKENLEAVDDELAQAILEYRAEYKVLSTYVRPMIARSYESRLRATKEPFIAPDSRIHANYRQIGARTGRMSCSDPNMQNQPRDDLRLRYNIVADPGYKLVTCDLSNIEMVLFAAYCGEGKLLTTLREGGDLHELTAEMIGLRDRRRPGGGYESARQQGKVFNFTIIYGGGMRSIKRYFRVDMQTARMYKNRYMRAYPEVGRLQTRIEYTLSDRGYLTDSLISGRRFRVDLRDSYKAVNYLVQGTAASLLKYAVNRLHRDGVPMVALVHDEIVAHVPEDEAVEVRDLIVRRMTEHEGVNNVVPLRADGDIVDRWSDAKPLKDEDGRLYLFDPRWARVPRRYLEAA